MFIFKKQTPSNRFLLKTNLEKAGSHTMGRRSLCICLSGQTGPPRHPPRVQMVILSERKGFSSQSLQIKTDTELVFYLGRQCISVPNSNYSSRNFKETRRFPGNISTTPKSARALSSRGLIKQNSLLTVLIHLIFNVTITLQLKVLVNGS